MCSEKNQESEKSCLLRVVQRIVSALKVPDSAWSVAAKNGKDVKTLFEQPGLFSASQFQRIRSATQSDDVDHRQKVNLKSNDPLSG